MKFRRQHPILPYYADFACVARMLVVEVDGDYHDHVTEIDLKRDEFLRSQGWDILRFDAQDVETDPELVAVGIARHLGLEYEFVRRDGGGSGMRKRR